MHTTKLAKTKHLSFVTKQNNFSPLHWEYEEKRPAQTEFILWYRPYIFQQQLENFSLYILSTDTTLWQINKSHFSLHVLQAKLSGWNVLSTRMQPGWASSCKTVFTHPQLANGKYQLFIKCSSIMDAGYLAQGCSNTFPASKWRGGKWRKHTHFSTI